MTTKLPAGLHDLQYEIYERVTDIYATHNGGILSYSQFPEALLFLIDSVIDLRPRTVKALNILGLVCEDARRKQFIRCNMANFDFVPDVSACLNKIATEYVNCGVRGNCFFEGHLCNGITYNDNKLTLRELKMMALIRKGLLDKEIAELLFASPETIKTTKRKIQKKLGVERKAMIAVVATEWQLN